MDANKKYENSKFPSSVLRSVRDLIDQQTANEEVEGTFLTLEVQISETESWTFDSPEEFFASYSGNPTGASFAYMRGSHGARIWFSYKQTSVTASAATRADIVAILNIFDEALASSSLPVQSASTPENYPELPTFGTKRNLPSCYVDKQIVVTLETTVCENCQKL